MITNTIIAARKRKIIQPQPLDNVSIVLSPLFLMIRPTIKAMANIKKINSINQI